jgi:NADH dehydrogenase FAD-containing subunit
VKVGPDLSVPGHQNIFVIGDVAHALGAAGQPLPGVAAVASSRAVTWHASLRHVCEAPVCHRSAIATSALWRPLAGSARWFSLDG